MISFSVKGVACLLLVVVVVVCASVLVVTAMSSVVLARKKVERGWVLLLQEEVEEVNPETACDEADSRTKAIVWKRIVFIVRVVLSSCWIFVLEKGELCLNYIFRFAFFVFVLRRW